MEVKYKSNPNYRQPNSTQKIMLNLTIGLAVVYAFGLFNAARLGTANLVNAIIMMVVALVCAEATEAIWAVVMKQPVVAYLKNSFGWVTAMILVLCCRSNLSPYAVGVATIIAIFFGKLVYGGFGQNVFNPAGVGRAVICTSFTSAVVADAVAGATPTSTLAGAGWLLRNEAFAKFTADWGGLVNLLVGTYNGAIGETSVLLLVAVAVFLAVKNVIDWRITVTYVGTIFLGTAIMGLVNGVGLVYPLSFVSTGGIFFAATFMLTDPVTCPNTRSGKIVFAALAGLFTVIIRLFANLPEGVVFSILLANMLTPVIDKVFLNKQVDVEKQLNLYVPLFVAAIVLAIVCCGAGLIKKYDYKTVNAPAGSVATTYEVQGFEYNPANKISVAVADGKIAKIEFVEFNDTEAIAGPCNTDDFLGNFVGLGSEDEIKAVDGVAGATFTTDAVKTAARKALEGAK